tara:strand:- start:1564 stop:1770 length:207 start_codon:yes stop_codon:yes gene_type:complete
MEDNVAQMEQDYEARLEARRELQSMQDQLDTMNEKIDSGTPDAVYSGSKQDFLDKVDTINKLKSKSAD